MVLPVLVDAVVSLMTLGLLVQAIHIMYNYRGSLYSLKNLSQRIGGGEHPLPRSIAIIPCRIARSSEEEVVYTLKSISNLVSSGSVEKAFLVVEGEDLEVLASKYMGYIEGIGVDVVVSMDACRRCSGKNRALITALKRVELCDGMPLAIVLLDCDAYHHPRAVETALRGAVYGGAIVTGYRWYVLSDIYGVLYNTVSSLAFEYMGFERTRIVWGGLVAIPLEIIKRLNLVERFSEEISDDAVISIEARRRGYRVIFCPSCISATPGQKGLGSFLTWAVRQMLILRLYTPKGFRMIFTIYLANTAFMVVAVVIAATSMWGTLGTMFLSLLLGYIAVGALRAAISLWAYSPVSIYGFGEVWGEKTLWRVLYVILTSVRAPLLLYILARAWIARRFMWRGNLYCIEGGRAYPCN